MKKWLVSFGIIMIITLMIGTFMYEKQESMTLPEEKITDANEPTEKQPQRLQPVNDETITYSLQASELNVTYDHGEHWTNVPIDKDLLFEGEYQGNEQALMKDSYILTKDYTAFLYSKDAEEDFKKIILTYSSDQGETWQDSVVVDSFSPMRFRKVDFLNDDFGYVILSGGRTMSQEYSTAFLTSDGGKTWEPTANPPTERLIAFGAFIDEKTGFLSYGTIHPEEPDVYTTQDSGETWEQSEFRMPETYDPVFVQAENPQKEANHLSVLVNQGPNGDYKGGKVKGKFISEDNGLTWDFSTEVTPNETASE